MRLEVLHLGTKSKVKAEGPESLTRIFACFRSQVTQIGDRLLREG